MYMVTSDLKELREKKNLNIFELSKKTGVTKEFLYRLERGDIKELRVEPVIKLMQFFNCSMERIFTIKRSDVKQVS